MTELWDPGALKNHRPNTWLGATSWSVEQIKGVGLHCGHVHIHITGGDRLVPAGSDYDWTWSIDLTGNIPTRLIMTGWPHRANTTWPDGCIGWDILSMCSLLKISRTRNCKAPFIHELEMLASIASSINSVNSPCCKNIIGDFNNCYIIITCDTVLRNKTSVKNSHSKNSKQKIQNLWLWGKKDELQ